MSAAIASTAFCKKQNAQKKKNKKWPMSCRLKKV